MINKLAECCFSLLYDVAYMKYFAAFAKQKEKHEAEKKIARVEIPQDAFLAVLKVND